MKNFWLTLNIAKIALNFTCMRNNVCKKMSVFLAASFFLNIKQNSVCSFEIEKVSSVSLV